jgi:hypothetical protein
MLQTRSLLAAMIAGCAVMIAPPASAQEVAAPAMDVTDSSPAPGERGPETEHCVRGYDASSPHLDLSVGGGYGAYFVTWTQASDVANLGPPAGRPADGLYQGPLVRAEVELGLGMFTLSVGYTHFFSRHDDGSTREWGWLTGGLGLQCACMGNIYVWSFGLDAGWDVLNHSVIAGIQHRSQFFVWQGLFVAVDLEVSLLVGLMSQGASGGGFDGALVVGYSI